MATNPFMITCAVVGAELTKEDYPYLPTTPEEIAEAARGAVEAGASIIHLHVRDEKGKPSQDVAVFREVTKRIRQRCDCIVQYSTGGAVGTPLDQRCAPLKLKPDMATLSMGTMNFGPGVFENTEETICTIAKAIQENGVMAELEIFDYGMMDTVERFLKKGYIPETFHVDFVLGVPGGMGGDIKDLVLLKNRLRPNQTWTVAGLGRFQLPLSAHALAMGGHVRVGIEDNIYFRKGELATSNAQLVERVVRMAKELDRPIATVNQAKALLGL
ncbi:MAG: 3-keto-5-aminohexanoate cleavage protein [Thermodesulfobacteriota bacterium]|nr:3-keto-5-aminohexanoate cleavage protein [Thermodesulfobacteriota bacterium]